MLNTPNPSIAEIRAEIMEACAQRNAGKISNIFELSHPDIFEQACKGVLGQADLQGLNQGLNLLDAIITHWPKGYLGLLAIENSRPTKIFQKWEDNYYLEIAQGRKKPGPLERKGILESIIAGRQHTGHESWKHGLDLEKAFWEIWAKGAFLLLEAGGKSWQVERMGRWAGRFLEKHRMLFADTERSMAYPLNYLRSRKTGSTPSDMKLLNLFGKIMEPLCPGLPLLMTEGGWAILEEEADLARNGWKACHDLWHKKAAADRARQGGKLEARPVFRDGETRGGRADAKKS